MSQAATEALIRRYYDAFNRGDVDGMLACLADDVVHDVNQGERRVGKGRSAISARTWRSTTRSS